MALEFTGVHAEILVDTTPEISVEGGRGCGKTTVCIWKELWATQQWPGIWIYIFRYDDTACKTKLRPEIERLANIYGLSPAWNATELSYNFANGSKIFCYGLKSVDLISRYSKLRGLAVSRVFGDQAEEIPEDIATELRAVLRPDTTQASKHQDFPRQLTFAANPPPKKHWLCDQFKEGDPNPRRKYYRLTLYSNKHHLPDDTIVGYEQAYPPDHPRFRSMIMGERGPNITGDPVYEHMFRMDTHLKPIEPHRGDLIEAFCTGKSHPTWVIAQRTRGGSIQFLAGVMGSRLFLTDFLPIVREFRRDWYGPDAIIKTCAAPIGADDDPTRFSDMDILRSQGFRPVWRENSNAPDVRLSMVEYLGDAMRRRTFSGEEAFAVNSDPDRWLDVSAEGIQPENFLVDGFRVGYVKDVNFISVGHKQVRQPKADDWYEFGMRCAELLVLNFAAGQKSDHEKESRRQQARQQTRQQSSGISVTSKNSWMA